MKLHPSKIYRLDCFEEAAGVLHELTEKEDVIIAHIGQILLSLPLDMEQSLRPLISQRITILRTDHPDKPFLFLILEQEGTS